MRINLYLYFGILFVMIGVANIEQVCVSHDVVICKETLLGCWVFKQTALVPTDQIENVLAEEAGGSGFFNFHVLTSSQAKVALPSAVFSAQQERARAENKAALILSEIRNNQLTRYGFPLWGFGAVGAVLCFLGLVINFVNWLLGRAAAKNNSRGVSLSNI